MVNRKLVASGISAIALGFIHWLGHEFAPSFTESFDGQVIFVGVVVMVFTFIIAYLGMEYGG